MAKRLDFTKYDFEIQTKILSYMNYATALEIKRLIRDDPSVRRSLGTLLLTLQNVYSIQERVSIN
jgi:hypothetical protein